MEYFKFQVLLFGDSVCLQAQMDAVHDVLDTKVNEKPFEDRRQNCWLFQAHRRHTMLREQFVRHIVTESALEVDMGIVRRVNVLMLLVISWILTRI